MQHGKELATYMLRICHIRNLLLAGGINISSILLNIFAVKGLGNGYAPANKDFALASSLLTSLDLEGIEINCANYTSSAAAIADKPDTYTSAAGKVASPSALIPQPTTALTPGVSTFPSSRPPPGRKVTAIMEKAGPACPL